MPEGCEYKITQTEAWELIRIRNKGLENCVEDKHNWRYLSYAYILLYKKRVTDTRFEDELLITIIPLFEIGSFGKVELYDSRSTWSVYANIMLKQVKFANYSSFHIRDDKLKGRGLGSYILSDLVQWVKQYHPTFAIEKLSVVGFSDNLSGASERREKLYEGVGFRLESNTLEENRSGTAVAQDSSVLHENRNPNKVESITLGKFVEIIEESSSLRKEKYHLIQRLELSEEAVIKLKRKINLWKVTTISLFITTIVLGFALYH